MKDRRMTKDKKDELTKNQKQVIDRLLKKIKELSVGGTHHRDDFKLILRLTKQIQETYKQKIKEIDNE